MEKHKTFKNILMIDGLITTRFDSGYILDAISEGLFSKGGCALVIGINEESMSVGDSWYMGRQIIISSKWKRKYKDISDQKILDIMLQENIIDKSQDLKIIIEEIDTFFEKMDSDS